MMWMTKCMDSKTDEEEREFDKKSTSGTQHYEKSQINTQVEAYAACLLLGTCFSCAHAISSPCLDTVIKNADTQRVLVIRIVIISPVTFFDSMFLLF